MKKKACIHTEQNPRFARLLFFQGHFARVTQEKKMELGIAQDGACIDPNVLKQTTLDRTWL